VHFLAKDDFNNLLSKFSEKIQNTCYPAGKAINPAVWLSSNHLYDGITNIKSRTTYIVNKNSSLSKRMPTSASKIKSRKLISILLKAKYIKFYRHGSKHDVYIALNNLLNPKLKHEIEIPRHHAKDLNTYTAKGILKDLGINGFDELYSL